jgi:nucleotide-binding universal stress UspA family protein
MSREELSAPSTHASPLAPSTQSTPSMLSSPRPVVVGVDGSLHNASAVDWAAEEAAGTGRTLSLVTGTGQFAQPRVGVGAEYVLAVDDDPDFSRMLDELADQTRAEHPTVVAAPSVRMGEASACLAELSHDAYAVVVGKRGLGAVGRAVLGSTSIATVGRSSCPTVVVPDEWAQRKHTAEPIVVGVDLEHDMTPVLGFAFSRADRLHVPLIALHVWDVRPFHPLRADERTRWASSTRHAVEAVIAPWRARYPGVEAVADEVEASPARGLLDAAEEAQLLVLGRMTSSARLTGLPFGSVTRAVLHYSERPVAVVPAL